MHGKPGRFTILLAREFDLAAGRIAGDARRRFPAAIRFAVVLSASAMSRSHRAALEVRLVNGGSGFEPGKFRLPASQFGL
jgi:hypothetical protein